MTMLTALHMLLALRSVEICSSLVHSHNKVTSHGCIDLGYLQLIICRGQNVRADI